MITTTPRRPKNQVQGLYRLTCTDKPSRSNCKKHMCAARSFASKKIEMTEHLANVAEEQSQQKSPVGIELKTQVQVSVVEVSVQVSNTRWQITSPPSAAASTRSAQMQCNALVLAGHPTVWPNHSLKWSANGRPPGPGLRYCAHFLSPGPGALPLSPT